MTKRNIIKYSDFISNYFYQQIAFLITKYLLKTKITPNQITILSLVLGIISGLFIILNNKVLAILFLNLSFIFDCVDGQLARVKNMQSRFGSWIDNVSDRVVENIIYISFLFILDNILFLKKISILIFLNFMYSYMNDLSIYLKLSSKKLSIYEKLLFSPIYFISRSMLIPLLSLFIVFPYVMINILIFLYLVGNVFLIYKGIKKYDKF